MQQATPRNAGTAGRHAGWTRRLAASVAVGIGIAGTALGCCRRRADIPPRGAPGPRPSGAATVWVVDDAERIETKAGVLPAMSGQDNAIWSPGQPVRLFGLPGETIALQVVVTAGDAALSRVEVRIKPFHSAGQADSEPSGVRIERFVEPELQMRERSGGKVAGESLGWALGAMPPDPSVDGLVVDPLIPIERAQPWADYPMSVPAGSHRAVWVDLSLRGQGPGAGAYASEIAVSAAGTALASIPVELQVGSRPLPYAAVHTMVYLDPAEIHGRTGSAEAVERGFQLLHGHQLGPVFPIRSRDDVSAYRDVLTGRSYTAERGYDGAGEGRAADVVAIGTYGDLGKPTQENVARLRDIVAALGELGIRDDPGKTDVFLYAADESCGDPAGAGWSQAVKAAGLPVRVGWTCSEDPSRQPVDIPIVFAPSYDDDEARQARAAGKSVWIYNGQLPSTGSFLTDSWTVSLRANAWIQAAHGIDRWFYWESTFWNDDNRGGKGPYDPLLTAETFHNQQGDHCNGDGVLMYPGRQVQAGYRNAGWAGVFPSIRMKQWRRGIQDAGYLMLARAVDRPKADAVADGLVGAVLSKAPGGAPAWPTGGRPWADARRRLFEIIDAR